VTQRFLAAESKPPFQMPAPKKTKSRIPSVPVNWQKEVDKILIPEPQIARRVKVLAKEIEKDFLGKEMVIVSLLNGTVLFRRFDSQYFPAAPA
jgi:hypothetical protein